MLAIVRHQLILNIYQPQVFIKFQTYFILEKSKESHRINGDKLYRWCSICSRRPSIIPNVVLGALALGNRDAGPPSVDDIQGVPRYLPMQDRAPNGASCVHTFTLFLVVNYRSRYLHQVN